MGAESTPSKRDLLIKELQTTETSYANNITTFHQILSEGENPISAKVAKLEGLSDEDKKLFFKSIHSLNAIVAIHNEIKKELEALTKENSNGANIQIDDKRLAKIQLLLNESMKHTAQYTADNLDFIIIYNKIAAMKDPDNDTKTLQRTMDEKLGEVYNQNLRKGIKGTAASFDTYAIMPVQRFPRYVMLTKEINENTPNTASEKQQMKNWAEKTAELAGNINEYRKIDAENKAKAKSFFENAQQKLEANPTKDAVDKKSPSLFSTIVKGITNIVEGIANFFTNKDDPEKLKVKEGVKAAFEEIDAIKKGLDSSNGAIHDLHDRLEKVHKTLDGLQKANAGGKKANEADPRILSATADQQINTARLELAVLKKEGKEKASATESQASKPKPT